MNETELIKATTDGFRLKYYLPQNEDVMLGTLVGLMIECARRVSEDDSEEEIISWIDSIHEETIATVRKMKGISGK